MVTGECWRGTISLSSELWIERLGSGALIGECKLGLKKSPEVTKG